jgi:hypothetical protein
MSQVMRDAVRHWVASHHFRRLVVAAILLSACLFSSCHKPAEPVTITFFDSDARGVASDHRMIPEAYLQEFTRETGIRVNDLPTPEDNGSKFDLAMRLLRSSAPSPDLYGVDTIWTGAMGEYLVDLQPYFAAEISSGDPALIEPYRIHGRVVWRAREREERFLGVRLCRSDRNRQRTTHDGRIGVASSRGRRPHHRVRWQDQRK